jgi:solute carrier family 25 oxoglutarate transporter 11
MADAKQQAAAPSGVWKTIKPFVNGGASGMLATCVIQPVDMIKVRIMCQPSRALSLPALRFPARSD